jgi:hypothetical protein
VYNRQAQHAPVVLLAHSAMLVSKSCVESNSSSSLRTSANMAMLRWKLSEGDLRNGGPKWYS